MHAQPLRPLTSEEIDTYREIGAVLLRGLFAPEWIELVTAAIDRSCDRPSPLATDYTQAIGGGGRYQSDVVLWTRDDALRSFVFDSPAVEVVRTLMGSEQRVSFFNDQTFVKDPGTGAATPWHNDQPFWPIRGDQVCTLWLSCDYVTVEDSGLEFVAGSHQWGKWFKAVSPDNNPYLLGSDFEDPPDVEGHRDEFDIRSWECQPGDVLVFHALTLHGSRGNNSTWRQRRAYSTRWCGDDATFDARPATVGLPSGANMEHGAPFVSDFWPLVWSKDEGRRPNPGTIQVLMPEKPSYA